MAEPEKFVMKTWKRDPLDKWTIFEVPYEYSKVKEILIVQGGIEFGAESNGENSWYLVKLPDSKIDETLAILRSLRDRGYPLKDGEAIE